MSRLPVLWLLCFCAAFSACSPAPGQPESSQASPALGGLSSVTARMPSDRWQPPLHASWQWQLSDLPLDRTIDALFYDVDLFETDAGTVADQLRFNRWLSHEAHIRGLSIGLKNDAEQVVPLLPFFDWAMTESCFVEGWCDQLQPFIAAGKPVFAAEYRESGVQFDQICAEARAMQINLILKRAELDAWRQSCDAEAAR